LKDNGTNVVLDHFPIESWKNMKHGWIHLHGHRHGTGDVFRGGLREDVGVDPFNFKPVSLDDLTKLWLSQGRLV
jgi:calcineurin-like phosphoesterase family protein